MDIEKLVALANIIDAKGLHSVAEKIDSIIEEHGPTVREKGMTLREAIDHYSNSTEDLMKVADSLDSKDMGRLADKIDAFLGKNAIEVVLDVYKAKHRVASHQGFCKISDLIKEAVIRKDNLPKEQQCPFGLSIPTACGSVGGTIRDMEPREAEFRQNKRLYEAYKQGDECPFAAQILKGKKAVNCSHGTETEGKEIPKIYHGSPIYPKLFEGFNTVNLDRNYYQYHDFGYYSLYG